MLLASPELNVKLTDPMGYGFGSIGPNFGATNLDTIPSSGGSAGYTRALGVGSIPIPTPTRYYDTPDGSGELFDGTTSIIPPVLKPGSDYTPPPVVNPSQSGDVNPTLDRLLDLYANQFGGDSAARTSGTPVVVVPQGSSGDSGSSVSPKVFVVLALAGVGYLGYRWYKGRAS
jgi:hypothetical protein